MMLIGLSQGCVFDLVNQEYSLFLDLAEESIGYHARRIEGDRFLLRRALRINGAAATAVDREIEASEMEALAAEIQSPEEAEAYIWFVRGFKGVPLRLRERTGPDLEITDEEIAYAAGQLSGI